jgi:hypothetical protein
MLCASWAIVEASRRAAARTRAPNPSRPQVPLDDGDLGEVALGVGDRLPILHAWLLQERLRHDLALDEPDHAREYAPYAKAANR